MQISEKERELDIEQEGFREGDKLEREQEMIVGE
jgi:hypothetical protein